MSEQRRTYSDLLKEAMLDEGRGRLMLAFREFKDAHQLEPDQVVPRVGMARVMWNSLPKSFSQKLAELEVDVEVLRQVLPSELMGDRLMSEPARDLAEKLFQETSRESQPNAPLVERRMFARQNLALSKLQLAHVDVRALASLGFEAIRELGARDDAPEEVRTLYRSYLAYFPTLSDALRGAKGQTENASPRRNGGGLGCAVAVFWLAPIVVCALGFLAFVVLLKVPH